jgi:hypothetical protein
MLGDEVVLVKRQSTMATLGRKDMQISRMEMMKRFTEKVPLDMSSVMLGEEVLLLERQLTMATLGRNDMVIFCLEMEITVFMGR